MRPISPRRSASPGCRAVLAAGVAVLAACAPLPPPGGHAADAAQSVQIKPVRPVDELLPLALAATPPVEHGPFRSSDLVELSTLDPTIGLDIRYASNNNFLGTPLYQQARAFLQRPAAEALVRVQRSLAAEGYGLLVHDGYRPWFVTKIFWDATPPDQHMFVADPAEGSRHNRGCAVDLTLYEIKSGRAVEMPSRYDEPSEQAYANYTGGTAEQRRLRDLLRRHMEAEGFSVYEFEWWHFDYRDWHSYAIQNVRFEDLGPPRQTLPVSLVPSDYALAIDPDAGALRFTGNVAISGDAPRGGQKIVLNAKRLTLDKADIDGTPAADISLDPALNRATLSFAAPFAAGQHVLRIAYHGAITQGTVGFFAMDYAAAAGKRRTLATNFEPAEARQFLPCWDEPSLKARFTVTVDAPADRLAVSNMPVASQEPLPDGRRRTHFAQSPPMSTYLLFLGVGDYERVHAAVDGVDVGVVVKRGDTVKASYALEQAGRILQYYNNYFGVRYPLPKLDLIAAPGQITGGSMENWGAIFFSQDHLLFDPAASTERERQLVFLVVAHEMAHQWFGDLVTMDWWDNLWLNEGFARWMQTHVADALHPEWETGLQAANIFESGKRADAKVSTHPVLQRVVSAEQATQAFDSITYDKGAAVITMLEAYVGADSFRAGVRRYMQAHAYGNTADADLWTPVAAAAGKPVLDIEHDFTRQSGVPLIRVQAVDGGFRLIQGRFAEDPDTAAGAPAASWQIPLQVAGTGGHGVSMLFSQPIDIAEPSPLVNAGAMAYARVAYPEPLARSLAARIGRLAPVDQINLMNDAWALGQSGYAPARNLLAFIAGLPADANPVVWRRAVGLLHAIDFAYAPSPARAAFRARARQILRPLAARLGSAAAAEPANQTTLRSMVWAAQAAFGDAAALERARRLFASDGGSIAERRTALEIVAGAADSGVFDALLARARAAQDPQEKSRLLEAMAGARDPALSARIVDIALGADAPAGTATTLLALSAQENPDAVWEALRPHLAAGALPIDPQTRWLLVPEIAGLSADPARVADIRQYADRDMPPDARQPVEAAISSIGLNRRVRANALPDINAWVSAPASLDVR